MNNSDYEKKWMKIFGDKLSPEQIEKASIGNKYGFLWHAFSYGFIPCLEGDNARKAYDNAEKIDATKAFYEAVLSKDKKSCSFSIREAGVVDGQYLTAKGIDEAENVEVYIIGKNEDWCYIRTHEQDFGPYFYVKS